MFFTAVGMEQATGEAVARYKAARFAGAGRLADLCCGIGGDFVALAEIGEAVGIERDPVCALFAAANCRARGTREVEVTAVDAAGFHVADFDAWHIDPDRRPAGRRTTRVESFQPDRQAIETLLAENENAGLKLAPRR